MYKSISPENLKQNFNRGRSRYLVPGTVTGYFYCTGTSTVLYLRPLVLYTVRIRKEIPGTEYKLPVTCYTSVPGTGPGTCYSSVLRTSTINLVYSTVRNVPQKGTGTWYSTVYPTSTWYTRFTRSGVRGTRVL